MRSRSGAISFQHVPSRYRCNACGNRTRFDVLSTKRSRAFHHFTLGGDLNVEEEEVLSLVVESVTCRWCGRTNAIEVIEDAPAVADNV
jgi:hypothetical protein